jgi:hypothetical protein
MMEIGGYTLPMLEKILLPWDTGQKIFLVVWLTMPIMLPGADTLAHL